MLRAACETPGANASPRAQALEPSPYLPRTPADQLPPPATTPAMRRIASRYSRAHARPRAPLRTAPRLRESQPANPAQQPAPAACVRAFPPTLLEWTRLAKRFRCPCRLRFSLPAEFPAANVPGVSSRGYEPLHTGRLRALHAWRRTFSDRASRS